MTTIKILGHKTATLDHIEPDGLSTVSLFMPMFAITNTHMEQEPTTDDWPDIIFCENKYIAYQIMGLLNGISYRDNSIFLRTQEPFLTKAEIDTLWLELKAPIYTATQSSYEAAREHSERIEPSIIAFKKIVPPNMVIEII